MKKLLLAFYLMPFFVSAQQDVWDTYLASYEKGPGSVVLNMSIKASAPVKEHPFVVITGVTFKGCAPDGLPVEKSLDTLHHISQAVAEIVKSKTTVIEVGSFTYQCERLDYIYVKDTAGLRASLLEMYGKRFPAFPPYLNIKEDREWKYYLQFLYPNELIREFMRNQKVLLQLSNAGDKLEKKRPIDHFAYFKSAEDRECFIRFITSKNYTVSQREKTEHLENPYKLTFLRMDRLVLYQLSEQTLELRREAARCKGEYDGWETVVVK